MSDFIVTPMKDPIGELRRVIQAVVPSQGDAGFGVLAVSAGDVDSIGYGPAVASLQRAFQIPETGVVDVPMLEALDAWGSSFTAQLENALEALGTSVRQSGIVPAIQELQHRLEIPPTGSIDLQTARTIKRMAYDPSDPELKTWLRLEEAPTVAEYVTDVKEGLAADVVREVVVQPGSFLGGGFQSFLRRVGRDPATYLGIAGTVGLRYVFPPLAFLPLAGALLYELTDEVGKIGKS